MKSARRLVAMLLAMLMVFALFSGCSNQNAVVEDDAAPVVSESVADDAVVSEADAAVEEAAPVEEAASGESVDSDVTMDLKLYMIETENWHNLSSRETVSVTPAGGTFTFSIETDWLNLSRIGSMYIKDKNVMMEQTSKSPFSSVSIAIEKYAINGVEFEPKNGVVYDEAIGGNGVFDYAFVNMWWTDGLKLSNCEPIHVGGPYAFTGAELKTDELNLFELTISIKPIDSANILEAKDIRRELKGITIGASNASAEIGQTVAFDCATWPAVCERDIYNFDSRVVWTSSDPSVATVANGVVTAVAEGTTVITASYGGFTSSCTLTVIAKPTAIVGLYANVNWADNAGSTVTIDADSVGKTYTLNVSWGNQGWWGGIHSVYMKDTASYSSGVATLIPNTIITLNSLTFNGENIDLTNAESLWVGENFNVELINYYYNPNNKVVEDQVNNNGNGYDMVDEDGNTIEGVTGGEFVLEFTVDSVSQ